MWLGCVKNYLYHLSCYKLLIKSAWVLLKILMTSRKEFYILLVSSLRLALTFSDSDPTPDQCPDVPPSFSASLIKFRMLWQSVNIQSTIARTALTTSPPL